MTLTPNTETRAGRMLEALLKSENSKGKLNLTVSVADADGKSKMHEVVRISKWTGRAANAPTFIFVAFPNTANWDAGIRPLTPIKVNLATGEIQNAKDDRLTPLLAWAAQKAFDYALTGKVAQPGNGTLTIQEESVCGACGLALTDDTSIALGIGPECEKKIYGTTTPRSKTISGKEGVSAPKPPEAPTHVCQDGELVEGHVSACAPCTDGEAEGWIESVGGEVAAAQEAVDAAEKRIADGDHSEAAYDFRDEARKWLAKATFESAGKPKVGPLQALALQIASAA